MIRKSVFSILVFVLGSVGGVVRSMGATPVGTEFTYQGKLRSGGSSANGLFDLQFSLWDAVGSGSPPAGGMHVGGTICGDNINVSDGPFTLPLDFGAQFNGAARWLQIGVRPAGAAGNCTTGVYTILSPRQPLSATAYAMGLRYPFNGSFAGSDQTVLGISQTGIGYAGSFSANNPGNYWGALGVSCGGSGPSLFVTHSGGGSCARLQNTVQSNDTFPTLHATTFGLGAAVLGDAGVGTNGTGISGVGHGTGNGVRGSADGTGSAGFFQISTASSSAAALYCQTNGTGPALFADGNVGIGTSTPAAKLEVNGQILSSTSGMSIRGIHDSSSGTFPGVQGETDSTSSDASGVRGIVNSILAGTGSAGIRGINNSNSNSYGVYGESASTSGSGVFGKAPATNGLASGVYGESMSSIGRGVQGRALSTLGISYGVYGESASGAGNGVYGYASATAGANVGVHGKSNSPSGLAGLFEGRVNVNGLFTLARTTITVTSGMTVVPSTSYIYLYYPGPGAVALDYTTAIEDAPAGTILVLQGKNVVISDNANTKLQQQTAPYNGHVLDATGTDTLILIHDGSVWVELAFTNNS